MSCVKKRHLSDPSEVKNCYFSANVAARKRKHHNFNVRLLYRTCAGLFDVISNGDINNTR